MPKYEGNKMSILGVSSKWVKSNKRREREERKSVLTMVSTNAWTNYTLHIDIN